MRTPSRLFRANSELAINATRLWVGSFLLVLGTGPALAQEQAITQPFARDAVTIGQMEARARQHAYVQGEVVVAMQLGAGSAQVDSVLEEMDWATRIGVGEAAFDRTLLSFGRSSSESFALLLLDVGRSDVFEAMRALRSFPDVLWSSPNFYSELTDPREIVPNDPMYASQYHHPLMQNDLAWDLTFGDASIVIAVTDDGVDTDHEDLIDNVWINASEVAGDGLDNDSNGYIDDVNGWDFVFDNNNPNPNSSGDDHGTHVAGITAGRTNNSIGIAGTAGGCSVMPLQFYASGQSWTAANIAETFAYAVDQGAQITTTSYNINGWVGDPVFTAGLQYLYDQGGMHFNSAGNGSELNPARQAFEQTFLVVSTDSADLKSDFSNYGTGVDISAPGSSILSTILSDAYGLKSGTSMASPNAAGVAALIWSQNPTWTRDQVAAQLMATADDIDGNNPGFEGWLGAGRANSFRALTETVAAPKIEALIGLPNDGATAQGAGIDSFGLVFDQIMDPDSVNASANYELRESGADGVFNTGDDQLVGLTATKTYMLSTNEMEYDITGGSLGIGDYRLTLFSGGLENPFGTDLDGNGDGLMGDDFTTFFTVGPAQLIPAGSLAYRWSQGASIDSGSETDSYEITLDEEQSLSVLVSGSGGLVPFVEVRDPGGSLVATGSLVGSSVVVQCLAIGAAGNYEVSISGTGGSTGSYELSLLLNGLFEEEAVGGPANDSAAASEALLPSALSVGVYGASRMAVVGRAGLGENFESGAVGSDWALSSSQPEGRIQFTSEFGAADGSAVAMLMDRFPDGADNLNEAVWTLDLSGVPSPFLNFYHAEWNDEESALPTTFTGSANGDGVSMSEDGITWHRIYNPSSQSAGVWQQINIDLAVAASNAGIRLGSSFRLKFQQFDNFPLSTDGRGYDEISITAPGGFEDWYSFELADGRSATLGVAGFDASASVSLDLFDSDGSTLIDSGSSSSNLSSVIDHFVDSTSNGTPDTYYARVSTSGGEYNLLVTRSATFDTESNDSSTSPQLLSGFGGVLGHVESGAEDYYRIVASAGERMGVLASLPAKGPFQFRNQLLTESGSALRMELFDPNGTLVATGTAILRHVATLPGNYLLRIFGEGGASGEYFLTRSKARRDQKL